jgi:caffeoyl-CoA O-methyltransferase
MQKNDIQFSNDIYKYILQVSLRENDILKELREETANEPNAIMQIPPEQGQFMAFLIRLIGAKKCLEIGTYTGYSALSIALAIPDDGKVITCDINTEWSDMGLKYWEQAKVNHKINLKIAPAIETLNELLDKNEHNTFDFVFIDADKSNYIEYYEKSLLLLRQNGIIAIDNVLLFGSVVDANLLDDDMKSRISDEDISIMRELNKKIQKDKRVDLSMLPIADGLTLVRKI